MTDMVVLLAIAAIVGFAGIAIGLRMAPRIDRWQEEREGPDDHG